MDVNLAIAFIQHQGDAIEQARLKVLLSQERPPREAVRALLSDQRADGGWSPFWAPDYSSLDATCSRLAQAEQLVIAKDELSIVRAMRFLSGRQQSDGSWEEDEQVSTSAPPWAKPGDPSARLYLTANCGFWLAVLSDTDDRALWAAGQAAVYIQGYLAQDGSLPSFLHTHWLAGGLCLRLNQPEPARRIFVYLASRLPDLSASHLAWMINALRLSGVSADHYLVTEAASLLEGLQGQNGSWQSEDGSGRDVHTTLEALQALRFCRRF